ncbi:tetratricopeptide repeat protein [Deinococcus sp. Leaf326]|uniref:ATP-binding protein n=1 Tax=Deinococcus sp. Leaf326 TaxID=1736338 RepID=UPI00070053EB|nr:tetratricopeptide repeat protein [Deinococcus sp. Leaf326]KQR25562.1 hypothetical protein ASF71_19135 [Deinococcus sp. Leaf326]
MKIWLLGGLWGQDNEAPAQTSLAPNLNTWVVAILAVLGQPMSREALAELLWPEVDSAASSNSLRQRLFRLKQTPLGQGVDATKALIRWTGDSDVSEFRRHHAAREWAAAIALYKGPLLHGVPTPDIEALDSWVEEQRAQLHADYLHALWQLTRQYQQSGQDQELVALLHQGVQLTPDDSGLVAELATTYLAHEDMAQARKVIEQHRSYLDRELGAPLPPALTDLLGRTHRTPPAPRLAPVAWGLPSFPTRFFGRAYESRMSLEQLTSPELTDRWLSIVGPGGMGKTRLAAHIARRYLAEQRLGVYFFSLAPLESEGHVLGVMLQALGVPVEGEGTARERLFRALGSRSLLLVLDNFEHLLGMADLLPALLEACPQVRVLVTSRQRLAFQAERVLKLGRLGELDHRSEGEATDSTARLFVDRARRADLTFDGRGQEQTMARIVEHCEGSPLAIEMAAALVAEYPLDEILRRLGESWDALQTSLHDVPGRHRSLRAVFAQSWQALPGPLREVYTALAVFRAPFTLGDAQAAGAQVDDVQILEQRSLLNEGYDGRYFWHESLRAYALEELGDALQQRLEWHLDHFLALAEGAAPRLKGREQAQVLGTLALIYPDLRSALGYALRTGATGRGLRLAGALHWFWYVRGLFKEGLAWLDLFLEQAEEDPVLRASSAYALALRCAGGLDRDRGYKSQAVGRYVAALEVYRALADREGQASVLLMQGILSRDLGEYPQAREAFGQAMALWQEIPDLQGLATTYNDLGILQAYEDNYPAAKVSFERSLELKREVGDVQGVAYALGNIANVSEDPEEVRALEAESLRLKEGLGDLQGCAVSYFNMGKSLQESGRLPEAADQFHRSVRLFVQIGSAGPRGVLLKDIAQLAMEVRQYRWAAELSLAALELESTTGFKMRPGTREVVQDYLERTTTLIGTVDVPAWAGVPDEAFRAALDFLEEQFPQVQLSAALPALPAQEERSGALP